MLFVCQTPHLFLFVSPSLPFTSISSSPEGSPPPQPRRLPGDGGQQEAGGQPSGPQRQQHRLSQLHDIQRHGSLLCPAAPRTPTILQRFSLVTQPNSYHGQGVTAKRPVTHSRRLPAHEGEEPHPGLRRVGAACTAAGLPGSHSGLSGKMQKGGGPNRRLAVDPEESLKFIHWHEIPRLY